MKQFNSTAKRITIYCLGLIILALGITLNTKTLLGVSPIVSVAYNLSKIINIPLGVMTFIYYILLILLQWIILRKDFEKVQWFQILASLITSFFIQIFDNILPTFSTVASRLVMLILAIVITAVGASLVVNMKFVPNPADGLASVLGVKIFNKDFGFGKNVFDLSSIVISLALGWIFKDKILGIGIGTVIAMILTGRVIALLAKPSANLYNWCLAKVENTELD